MRDLLKTKLVIVCMALGAMASLYAFPKIVYMQVPAIDAEQPLLVRDEARVIGVAPPAETIYLQWQVGEQAAEQAWELAFASEVKAPLQLRVKKYQAAASEPAVAPAVKTFGSVAEPSHPSADAEPPSEVVWQGRLSAAKDDRDAHWLVMPGNYLLEVSGATQATEFQLILQQGDQRYRDEQKKLTAAAPFLDLQAQSAAQQTAAAPAPQPAPVVFSKDLATLPVGHEYEPNDRKALATALPLGATAQGTLHSADDTDYFRLYSANDMPFNVTIEPPPGTRLRVWLLPAAEELGANWTTEEKLIATTTVGVGDYILAVQGDIASSEPYRVTITPQQPWALAADYQLTLEREQARGLPPNGVLHPPATAPEDVRGWYRLPVADAARTITWQGSVHRSGYAHYTGIKFVTADGETIPAQGYGLSSGSVEIPAGAEIFLEVTFGGSAKAVTLNDPFGSVAYSPQIALAVSTKAPPLRALADVRQQVALTLVVENLSGQELTVPLVGVSSVAATEFIGLPESLALAPNETRTIMLAVVLPAGLTAFDSVYVFLGSEQLGEATQLELATELWTPLVDPILAQPEDALVGTTNLAWQNLGAQWPKDTTEWQAANDGWASAETGAQFAAGLGELSPVLELAGGGGLVQGIAVQGQTELAPTQQWRDVEFVFGEQADDLSVHRRVRLQQTAETQYFAFSEPFNARFAAVRPLSTFAKNSKYHGVGDISIFAQPQEALRDPAPNLLAAEFGGYLLYATPQQPSAFEQRKQRRFELVYGFYEQRQASIGELHWQEPAEATSAAVSEVQLFAANTSPLGPWEFIDTWQLEPNASGLARYTFTQPQPMRYLKLVIDETTLSDESSHWHFAEKVSAYSSVPAGAEASLFALPDRVGNSVNAGTEFKQQFRQPGDSYTETVVVTDPHNSIRFTLRESQTGRLQATLVNAQGETIPLQWQQGDGERSGEAVGLEAGTYELRLTEPLRSIVFVWDGSLSVAHHQDAIYQALREVAKGIRQDAEVVNLLPMGGPLLLANWASKPEHMIQALALYDNRYSSSEMDKALREALKALDEQVGENVIFLLTDAMQGQTDHQLWQELAAQKPRIFAIQLPAETPGYEGKFPAYKAALQTLANVNDGAYYYASDRRSISQAIYTGMRQLRTGTAFSLSSTTFYQEPPQPAQFAAHSGDEPVLAAGALQLVFDASGSMLQRMQGERRIDVAKRMVRQVLSDQLPAQMPIALRAFGHTEPHSCETELLVAAAEGKHDAVLDEIAQLQAVNLAKTPLAASLAAVASDLQAYQQAKQLVVVLTDGEETCGGNLTDTVTELSAQGIDLQLNIVGFQLADRELEQDFTDVAEGTGGGYFASADGDELAQALRQALAPQWQLVDSKGVTQLEGRIGDAPQEVAAGAYQLRVFAHPELLTFAVELAPEQQLTMEVFDAQP
jgi:hypothetical protein